jgi:hypothetical protein
LVGWLVGWLNSYLKSVLTVQILLRIVACGRVTALNYLTFTISTCVVWVAAPRIMSSLEIRRYRIAI